MSPHVLCALVLLALLKSPTRCQLIETTNGDAAGLSTVPVTAQTENTTDATSEAWKNDGDLEILTDGLPPGYSGRLASQNGSFSSQLSENVSVSEYLVKDDDGNVAFSVFLEDPTKVLDSKPIVVQVDFGLAENLNICFYNIVSGLATFFCPDGADAVALVSGNKTSSTFEIMIFDDGRVQADNPTKSPMYAKLTGRPISATNNSTAVPFSMTVINATTDVYLQLEPGQAATRVVPTAAPPESSSSFDKKTYILVGVLGGVVVVFIIIGLLIWRCVECNKKKEKEDAEAAKKPEPALSTFGESDMGPSLKSKQQSQNSQDGKTVYLDYVFPSKPGESMHMSDIYREADRLMKERDAKILPVCDTQRSSPSRLETCISRSAHPDKSRLATVTCRDVSPPKSVAGENKETSDLKTVSCISSLFEDEIIEKASGSAQ